MVPVLENRLAYLGGFSNNFTTEGTRTIEVEKHTVHGTVQTNPSSYVNTGDTTTLPQVAVAEYSAQFGLTSAEQLAGHKLVKKAKRNAHALADKIWDVLAAKVTAATFTNTAITVAQASIAAANVRAAWASIAKARQKTLVLDSTAYSQLMVTTSQDTQIAGDAGWGFDRVDLATDWSSIGTTNCYGFAAGPEAFLVATGIPQYSERVMEMLDESIVELPELGLSVAIRHQVDINARSEHASFDVLFGAAAGDASALTIIKSA